MNLREAASLVPAWESPNKVATGRAGGKEMEARTEESQKGRQLQGYHPIGNMVGSTV
jgi:hypothetical protein